MNITAILLSLFLGSALTADSSFAQSTGYHVMPGAAMLICKATGKVDGITNLFLTETTEASKICGAFTVQGSEGRPDSSVALCLKGSLNDSELVLSSTKAQYGDNAISIRLDAQKGYSVVKAFTCDWNHEENCLPGVEQVLAEEAMDCHISKLKY